MTGKLLKQVVLPSPILGKMADCGGGDPYQSGGRWAGPWISLFVWSLGNPPGPMKEPSPCGDDAQPLFALGPVLLITEGWGPPTKERKEFRLDPPLVFC